MLKMFLTNAVITLHCSNTETFLHQQTRSYVSRCRTEVMALPPAGKPHRIPIGFLFSHLNRITNDTRSGNSNNWCLSVVWPTSSDADQLHTRKQHRRLSFLALNYKRTIIVLKIRIPCKNMENDTDDVKASSITLLFCYMY